jgi:hypothetical protein
MKRKLNRPGHVIIFKMSLIILFVLMPVLITTSCCYLPLKIQEGKNNGQSSGEEKFIEEMEFSGFPDARLISNIKVSGQAIDVDISGNYAYLTNDLGVLYIIDIRNKENPSVIGKCKGIDSANIVIVNGDYAYISYDDYIEDGNDNIYTECGFYIVDVSEKASPRILYDYNTGVGKVKFVNGLFIDGDYAYVSTSVMEEGSEINKLEIIDISNKKAPRATGSYDLEGIPSGIWIEDNKAYINVNYYDFQKKEYTEISRLYIIDIKDKQKPGLAGSCRLSSNSWGILVIGNQAYISSWKWDRENEKYIESMLQVVDMEDISNPEVAGECEIMGGAWELDEAGGYIYTSSLSGGIYAVDVLDRENPFVIDSLKTFGISCDITISGNYGYIADGNEGMSIVMLSGQYSDEKDIIAENADGKNFPPEAIIEIFGDTQEGYYQTEIPVYMSALKTYDIDGDELHYRWLIDDEECSDEDSFYYYFYQPGDYEVKLIVDDGLEKSEISESIKVTENILSIITEADHTFKVEIEYVLINNGIQSLKDIECFMRIPQTYEPFQTVNGYKANIENVSEVLDSEWNLLAHFEFEDDLLGGESLVASVEADVNLSEFFYKNYESTLDDYDIGDEEMQKYTSEDLFIDSDNPVIYNTAKSLIRDESDPVAIAEILYYFVIRNLYYDYQRAKDRDYELLYASEILERGAGVCADYAILYTALLRSVGVPSRLSAGIPVYTILWEPDKEIDIGHAWVEVNIPDYGWIPVDITVEDDFMTGNYYLNITTERGPGYLYESTTMDWSSYYYDGFSFLWSGSDIPDTEQKFLFRVDGISLEDIRLD